MYELLQEGGIAKHATISAGDKDFPIVFKKICALVSTDLFKMASADIPNEYAGDERALKNAVDDILDGEGEFLDTMYGFQSRLHNEVWLDRVTSQGRYVFDAV